MAHHGQSGSYSFVADPRAVAPRGNKYRMQQPQEEELPEAPGNIMYDPRVVRGSTFGARGGTGGGMAGGGSIRRMKRGPVSNNGVRPITPNAVAGRKHIDVQTDDYLEELTDRPPEKDQTTQTYIMKDRPPSPLFMPAKAGVDATTQIEKGDLFDFNVEVDPILEVLVGKTLEQGMDEILEEEELANIRAHKNRFEQQRNVQLAEVQRLEAEARRREEEKARRLKQEADRVQQEEEIMEKVAARGFAKNFLGDLHQSVFDKLIETGHFYDPVAQEVEQQFMPWLHERVEERIDKRELAQQLADKLIMDMFGKIPENMEEARQLNEKFEAEKKAREEAGLDDDEDA